MEFAKAIKEESNKTFTENGAVSLKSTNSALVDLFASIGALRTKSDDEVVKSFRSAFVEDRLLATKMLFYARNVRGGLGERKVFRTMLKDLATTNPEIVVKNIELIPVFGRYDDLYELIGTEAEFYMWSFLNTTIQNDIRSAVAGKPVSLCAKWLKSVNTSSHKSNELGKLTAKNLGMTERKYRKVLAGLRAQANLPEVNMFAKNGGAINIGLLLVRVMKDYGKTFQNEDPVGFAKFMEKVEKGEVTIKAGTLYPYDILMGANLTYEYPSGNRWDYSGTRSYPHFKIDADAVLEAQWKALPNYVSGENNVLVMSDTSGSMESDNGRPMATAIGLAVYFAERNKGAYKDLFLTFSESPRFVNLSGNSLAEKISNIESIVANTNLESAFDLILKVAVDNNVSTDEMPKSLIIISDMQFDGAVGARGTSKTFFNSMKDKFASKGYTMPTVIFWQVSERGNAFQADRFDANVILVSGQSTSTFKGILSNIGKTPFDFMCETLADPIYDVVKI